MPDEDPRLVYSLFDKHVMDKLGASESFIELMIPNYNFIANRVGCETVMSKRRLSEAHMLWQTDVARTLNEGISKSSKKLDHFKHAAFLAFWLRRLNPINETLLLNADDPVSAHLMTDPRIQFFRYGNEMAAIQIGFQICLFFECARTFPKGGKVANLHGSRIDYLRKARFPAELLCDYAMILKHKSMSPHSLYLMYRSLFASPNGDTAHA